MAVQQHGRLTQPGDHQIAAPVMVEVACRKVVEPTLELISLNDVLGCEASSRLKVVPDIAPPGVRHRQVAAAIAVEVGGDE